MPVGRSFPSDRLTVFHAFLLATLGETVLAGRTKGRRSHRAVIQLQRSVSVADLPSAELEVERVERWRVTHSCRLHAEQLQSGSSAIDKQMR